MIIKITVTLLCFLLPGIITAHNTCEAAFTAIYDDGVWGHDAEGHGISGGGSIVANAQPYMQFLQNFLRENNIHSVVDVGCGDWSFSQYIDWHGIKYIGYDVVKSVIDKNTVKFSNKDCQFIHGDFLDLELPPADLLLCKDVLQHLPHTDIQHFLKQCSKFKHCLITNDVDILTGSSENNDISQRGNYHTIDLMVSPFNVPGHKIFSYISENCNRKQVVHIVSA
jgi:SAM-dependent methyltransferase